MTQTALNDWLTLPSDTWTLVSEIDCTFVNVGATPIEIRGDTGTPDADEHGVVYSPGQGEDASTGTLARFAGLTATGIYARPSSKYGGLLFVSRASVA